MVEKEEHPKGEAKWEGYTDPLPVELPELDQPFATAGRLESSPHRKSGWIGVVEAPPVRYPRGCNECNGHAVVSKKPSDMPMEVRRLRQRAEKVRRDEHEQGKYNTDKGSV